MGIEIQAALAAIALVEKLLPVITEQFKAGQVTAEEQQAVNTRYLQLRSNLDGHFLSPEWKIEQV